MELLTPVLTFVAGIALGFAGYRYFLKRNPEKLEAWARQIKLARQAAEAQVRR